MNIKVAAVTSQIWRVEVEVNDCPLLVRVVVLVMSQ